MADFTSLGLSDWLILQCKQMGISKPTPVQENCIPAILEGKLSLMQSYFYKSTTTLWSYALILHNLCRLYFLAMRYIFTSSACL